MLVLSTIIVYLNFEDTAFKIVNGLRNGNSTISDQFIGLLKAIDLKNGCGIYSRT
jgi:hypothetical protein